MPKVIRASRPSMLMSSVSGKESLRAVVFIEWRAVVLVCLIAVTLTTGACGIRLARKKRWPIRLPFRLFSSVLVVAAVVAAVFIWSFRNPNKYSVPVYSPKRKMAARVCEYDASGGFGRADNSVELFAAHGFKSRVVFFGENGSVEIKDIQWKRDSELEVGYHGTAYNCAGAFEVKVRCVSRQPN